MLLELSNCCFCVDLKIGSQAIGYLSVIWNSILAILAIVTLANGNALMFASTDIKVHIGAQIAVVVLSIVLCFVIINIVFDIVLLVGIYKHNREYVKAYLICTSIYVMINVVSFIANFFFAYVNVLYIIRDGITVVLSVYFLIVVRSYYAKMEGFVSSRVMYSVSEQLRN